MNEALSRTAPDDQTRFDAGDLTIRNRVLAFKAALDATPVDAPAKDALLSQFLREVADLTAQLAQAEKMFGSGDPMVHVLREALGSATSRRDTRKIELGLDTKEKASVPTVQAVQPKAPQTDDSFMGLAFLMLITWNDARRRALQTNPAAQPTFTAF